VIKIETTSRQKAKSFAKNWLTLQKAASLEKDWLSCLNKYTNHIFATVVVYGRDNRVWIFKFVWSDVCGKWLYD
jgi:hypothetical protein